MKKNKKEMSDTKRIIIFTLVIVIVVILISVSSFMVLREKQDKDSNNLVKKNTHEIVGYGITVDDLDSPLYQSEFEKLKTNLESGNIDFDQYAESVAKLFVIDLYTIKTKINKYDIGGLEFVLPERRDNYSANVTDTLYKYVEDNTNGKRRQNLPVVSAVNVSNTKKNEFKIKDTNTSYSSYVIEITLDYTTDLGYDTKAEVTVINKDNFMYVVEKN